MTDTIHPVRRPDIVGPRPKWPADDDTIATDLRRLFAEHDVNCRRLDHIGPTAVPGLVANDTIDIQASVAALDDDRLRSAMIAGGYRWHPDVDRDHSPAGMELDDVELAKRLASVNADGRSVHVHFRVAGRFNHRAALLWRDYLRTHPHAAAAYGQVERALSAIVEHDAGASFAAKDPVDDLIVAAAEEWASTIRWRPSWPEEFYGVA